MTYRFDRHTPAIVAPHAHTNDRDGGKIRVTSLADADGSTPLSAESFPHVLLDATVHTDTATATVSRGSMIVGNTASPSKWGEVTVGAANAFWGSDGTDPSWTAAAALTKGDDTNVTLTLGGSPTTALLRAASITAGWTGTLAMSRGGAGRALTAADGGIVYSDADSLEILAATATAGQVLRSGANAAPSWSTATYPATAGSSGNLLVSDGTNWASAAPATVVDVARSWTTLQKFPDDMFNVVGSADATKIIRFEVDGNTTGTTRTYTVKDANGTIPLLGTNNLWTGQNFFQSGSLNIYDLTNSFSHTILSGLSGGGPITLYLPNVASNAALLGFGTTGDMPFAGELPYGAGANQPMNALAIGTAGQILKVNAGATAPEWDSVETLVDVARTWDTLQKFEDAAFQIVDESDATKLVKFDVGSAGTGDELTLAWAGTDDRTVTFPDVTTTLMGLAGTQTVTGAKTFASGAAIFGEAADDETVPVFNGSTDTGDSRTYFATYTDVFGGFSGFLRGPQTPWAADVSIDLPNGSGEIQVQTNSATLQNKRLSTGCYLNGGTTSAAIRLANTSSTTNYINWATAALTGARTHTVVNETGLMPLVGNTAVAAAGTAAETAFGKVDLTNQTASVGSTIILNGTTASTGCYLVDITAICRTAAGSGDVDTVTVSIASTSNAVSRTLTTAALNLDNTANILSQAYVVHCDNSTDIALTTTYSDVGGGTDGAYDLHVRVLALG